MNRFVRCSLSAAAGMALACAGAHAQNEPQPTQQSPAAQPTSPTTQAPTPQTQTPQQQADTQAQPQKTLQMVPAQAELSKTIDAKKAKQGDPVTAKLVAEVKIPDAQPLPKNTILEGHVDQVTASEHKSDSTVVVTFDKAKLKDGQELPIKATVIAVSEPALAAQSGAAAGGAMPAGGGMPSGGGAPSGGAMRGSGGAEGSQTGAGSSGSAGAMAPQQPMNTPDGTSGARQQAGGGVPDVKLTSDIHQHSSATFTSKGKNVHVPDGTQMRVAIAVIPAGVKIP